MQIDYRFYYIQILHIKFAHVFYLAKTVLTLNRSVACTVDGPPKFRTVTMCGRFKYWIVKIKPAFRYTDVNVNRDTFTMHIIYANASPRVGTVSTGAKANCKYWILLQA